jgi:hypothetical protein
MEEQLDNRPAESPPRTNRGWFRPGDRRINREGRPRGSPKAGPEEQADRAPAADRVMLLVLPARAVAYRLTHERGAWIANAPRDIEIVGSRVDVARGALVFVLRSAAFPRIAKGAVIPQFTPEFNGLRWQEGLRG